jgi:hypothetical protein
MVRPAEGEMRAHFSKWAGDYEFVLRARQENSNSFIQLVGVRRIYETKAHPTRKLPCVVR